MRRDQEATLRSKALRGFAFFSSQTVLTKLAGIFSQYALSWLLLPMDFGLLGMAFTVTTVASITTQIGLREFLMRRSHPDVWAEPAFWLGLTLSTICTLLMCMFAPIAARLYHDDRIASLIFILALGQPFLGMSVVLSALLQKRMQFGRLAATQMFQSLGSASLSVALAWLGFGVYSLVVPVSAMALLQFVLLLKMSGLTLRWRVRARRWKAFYSTGSNVLATNALMTVNAQGDYIILGILQSATTVGMYFFAFNLAVQVNRFFWASLTGVLFPLMSSIQHDTDRLVRTFRNATSTMAVLIVPVCILQAAVADPVIRLFFASKWVSAIPAIQVMSVGMGLHTIAEPCIPLLQAQGRFTTLTRFTAAWTLFYIPAIYLAARVGTFTTVAVTVAAFYAIASPIYFYFVVRPLGMKVRDVASIYLPSAVASLLSAVISTKACSILNIRLLPSLLLIPTIFIASYGALIFLLAGQMTRAVFIPLAAQFRGRARYEPSNT